MVLGKWIFFLGLGLALIGLILMYAPSWLQWFGKLPGDIRIEDENRYIFIPLTSMLLLSVVITLLINLFLRR